MNDLSPKHVIIFSVQQDTSTDSIIDWLDFYGLKSIRIDNTTFFKENAAIAFRQSSSNINSSFVINNTFLSEQALSGVYYRKGKALYQWKEIEKKDNHEKENIKNEIVAFIDTLKNMFSLLDIKKIGNIAGDINKSTQLSIATKVGLEIPDTIITTSKKELLSFAKNREIIIKAIDYLSPVVKESKIYMYYSSSLGEKQLLQFSDFFLPTLCQEEIQKEIELRVIYINGSIFSAAIFSQMHSETITDYRKYNKDRKNRIVPYALPAEIEKKITKFMNLIELNTGSIDLIKSINGKYYFLEVNPSGQFETISKKCNFAIEKEFAKFFTKK
jgi:ATP-GRASP peptide maturase of grasp-with-spasm system